MPRDVDSILMDEFRSGKFRPVLFVEADFASGPVYFWSGLGTVTWNAHDWIGVGRFGEVTAVVESGEVRADNLVLSLSAIPYAVLNLALNEIRHGKPVKIWLGAMSEARGLIGNPYRAYGGRMDACSVEEQPEAAKVSITVENRLVDLQRPRISRYTHEDQQLRSPGDRGFEYVPQLQEWNGGADRGVVGGGGESGGGGGDSGGGGGRFEGF